MRLVIGVRGTPAYDRSSEPRLHRDEWSEKHEKTEPSSLEDASVVIDADD